jgi:hypothetical protein
MGEAGNDVPPEAAGAGIGGKLIWVDQLKVYTFLHSFDFPASEGLVV